jgi:hypothetical protein
MAYKCGESYETLETGKDDGGMTSTHNDKGTPVKGSFVIDGPLGVGTDSVSPKTSPNAGRIRAYKRGAK